MQRRKNVFLYMSHVFCEEVIEEYRKLLKATEGIGEIHLLYHLQEDCPPENIVDFNPYFFTSESLSRLNYPYYNGFVVPGCTQLPLLQFFREHDQFDYYWFIEYDVRFSGDWRSFFSSFSDWDEDLLTCYLRSYHDGPNWVWWELKHPSKEIPLDQRYASFDPIYRISQPALAKIDNMLQDGWCGHHEVLLPSLLFHNGFRLRDFGGKGRFVYPGDTERFYITMTGEEGDPGTVRDAPPIDMIKENDGKLYHPVKPKKWLSIS